MPMPERADQVPGREGIAPPVRWADLAWPDIGALTEARPTEVGLLPVGATEQHGPHLPAGTDTVIATTLADLVSARTGAPVLPALSIASSYGHGTTLPGTLSLSPELLARLAREAIEWAALSGLRRVLLVNAHFGNQAALGVATDHVRLHRPDLRAGIVGWWAADAEVTAEVLVDGEDIHANRAETSLMMAIAPQLVRAERIPGADDPDRTAGLVFRYSAPALSTNGVTGRPSEATPELGAWILERTVDAICALVERGRVEEPPLVDHVPGAPAAHAAGHAAGVTG
jgi:creatinine amidohydrolase